MRGNLKPMSQPGGPDPDLRPPPLPQEARPRRGIRLLLLAAVVLTSMLVAAGFVARWFIDRGTGRSSQEVAREFVSLLKYGEETPPAGDQETIGYARAWALLAAEVRARLPFESFYQEMIGRVREHGAIMAGEPVRKRKGERARRRELVFRLLYGDDRAQAEDMTAFHLVLAIAREDDRWVVADYRFEPADAVKNQ